MGCDDQGTAGVVEDSEGLGGRWDGGSDEVDELVGEVDIAAAGALVIGFGHVTREHGAGHVGVVVIIIVGIMSVGAWGVEGCVWWVLGAWVRLRHACCLC